MLTQKLVKLIMMNKFRVGDQDENKKAIVEAVDEFEATMKILKNFKWNNQIIEEQLQKVKGAWERFLSSMTQGEFDLMIEVNGEVLIEMDKAVGLYEDLFRSQKVTKAYTG